MPVKRAYLVIGADRRIRAAWRPQIRAAEVAIAINLAFPDTWGRVVATIDLPVPDFAPTEVRPE
jgi:hypothetical protein